MTQEFNVLRCFSCRTFQVQQVKKSKKWNCKMCGEKQSLLKVYGHGSGADCRRHTQKLNALWGETLENEDQLVLVSREQETREEAESAYGAECIESKPGLEEKVSRWSKYVFGMDKVSESDEDEVNTDKDGSHSQMTTDGRKKRKRKKNCDFLVDPVDVQDCRSSKRQEQMEEQVLHSGALTARAISPAAHTSIVSTLSPAVNCSTVTNAFTMRKSCPEAKVSPMPESSEKMDEVTSSKWDKFLPISHDSEEDEYSSCLNQAEPYRGGTKEATEGHVWRDPVSVVTSASTDGYQSFSDRRTREGLVVDGIAFFGDKH